MSSRENNSKRERTKKLRAIAFKQEIGFAEDKTTQLRRALAGGDYYEINKWYERLGLSMEYLYANDPRREKGAPK